MACEIVVGHRSLFVVWGKPEIPDFERVLVEFNALVAASNGPITYVTRVPASAEAPDSTVRKTVNTTLNAMIPNCITYHVVLEGTGIVGVAKRSVLAAMFLGVGRRGTFFIHAKPDEVIARVRPEAREDVAALLRDAESRGLLTGPLAPMNATA